VRVLRSFAYRRQIWIRYRDRHHHAPAKVPRNVHRIFPPRSYATTKNDIGFNFLQGYGFTQNPRSVNETDWRR
jgi:hypothetical protein